MRGQRRQRRRRTPSTGVIRLTSRLLEQAAWWNLDGSGQAFQGRDLGIPFACLDPADLGRVDATAFGNLLLSQPRQPPGGPQVLAEVAHAGIVGPASADRHSGDHKFSRNASGSELSVLEDHVAQEDVRDFCDLQRLSPPRVIGKFTSFEYS